MKNKAGITSKLGLRSSVCKFFNLLATFKAHYGLYLLINFFYIPDQFFCTSSAWLVPASAAGPCVLRLNGRKASFVLTVEV